MTMRTLFLRKKRVVMATLLALALILYATGMSLESSLHGTWTSQCEIKKYLDPLEISLIGDVWYLEMERDFTIHVFRSYDGCNWFEIELDIFKEDDSIWRHSVKLFITPGDNLGMAWVEEESTRDKESFDAIFWSSFDGSVWSEPELLIQRDASFFLSDVIMLEDGAFLLLWEERLIRKYVEGDNPISGSGCDIIYTAYVKDNERLIEQLTEPEYPLLCSTEGYCFVHGEDGIWCVFREEERSFVVYGSWSEDDRQWSEPNQFKIPGGPNRGFFLTQKGEISTFKLDKDGKNLFLLSSPNWKDWSREKLFETEKSIIFAKIIQDENGEMWGFVETDDEILLIQHSQDLKEQYEKNMRIVTLLESLSLIVITVLFLLVLSWMRKRT